MSTDAGYMLIRVALSGAREAAAETAALRGQIAGTGATAAEANAATAASATKSSSSASKSGAAWAAAGKAAKVGVLGLAGAGVALGIASHHAVDSNLELAKTAAGLQRNLGLSAKAASSWAAVAEARDISPTSLGMAFTTMSKQIVAANADWSSSSADSFKQLGITQDQVAAGTKDFSGFVGVLADQLGEAKGSAERQAAAAKLMGRGYQTVLPIFAQGSKGLEEQLGLAEKYHVAMSGKMLDDSMTLVQSQRELNMAQIGFNEALAHLVIPMLIKLIPILETVLGGVSDFLRAMEEGEGTGGKFATALHAIGVGVGAAVNWIKGAADWVQNFIDKLKSGRGEIGQFGQDFKAIGLAIKNVAVTVFPYIIKYAGMLWSAFKTSFHGIVNVIEGVVKIVGGILRGDWSRVWEGAKQLVVGMVQMIIGAIKTISAPFRMVFSGIAAFIGHVFDSIKAPIVSILNFVIDRVNNLIDAHNALPFLPDIPHISNIGESIPMPSFSNTKRASQGPGLADYGNSPGSRITPRSTPPSMPPKQRPRTSLATSRGRSGSPVYLLLDGKIVASTVLQHASDSEARR